LLDLDTTRELNGKQEGRFFHGYYGRILLPCRCTSSLANTCCACGLRGSRPGRGGWVPGEVQRIVNRFAPLEAGCISSCAPTAASAAMTDGLGRAAGGRRLRLRVPRNNRLRRLIVPQLAEASAEHARTGKPARSSPSSCTIPRRAVGPCARVVAKAEAPRRQGDPPTW